jgi:outer membrane lipase/esterase
MTRKLRQVVLAIALAVAAGPAIAATVRYDNLYVMGDSLSDVGNIHELTRGLLPQSPPYDRLRYSNGKIWVDHVAAAVAADGGRARNFAYAGAHAIGDSDFVPDLQDQRRMLLDRIDPRPSDLGVIWMGGNDLLDRVGRDNIRSVARNAADEVFDAARALQRNGFNAAMIFNMPNFADVPRYVGASASRRASALSGTEAYNLQLDGRIGQLRDRGMEVVKVDVFRLFGDVVANPTAYGLTNLTRPCIRDGANRCTAAEARVTAFADDIHPSAALHAILGRHVLDLLAPPPAFAALLDGSRASAGNPAAAPSGGPAVAAVPLPAPALLLLAALSALGLASRRRSGPPEARPAARLAPGSPHAEPA